MLLQTIIWSDTVNEALTTKHEERHLGKLLDNVMSLWQYFYIDSFANTESEFNRSDCYTTQVPSLTSVTMMSFVYRFLWLKN